ncbi:MAG: transcription termination/antitermination NusG family protein [Pirellulaceae bacterium]
MRLRRRIKLEGLEDYFDEILVPTEDVREYNKSGKPRIVKKRLYPGYVVVNMSITDETWFIVRDTAGVGDFTGAAGKPTPLTDDEVSKILQVARASQVERRSRPRSRRRFDSESATRCGSRKVTSRTSKGMCRRSTSPMVGSP